MLLLNVYYKAKPGMGKAFYDAVQKSEAPALSRAEAGNIKYDYFFSDKDEDTILLIEHWKDEAAFQSHIKEAHFKRLGEIKAEYVENTHIDKVEIADE